MPIGMPMMWRTTVGLSGKAQARRHGAPRAPPTIGDTKTQPLWSDAPARPRATVGDAPPRRRPARRRPVVVDVLAAAAGIGLGVTIGLAVTAESAGSLSAPGGIAIALGRLAGLLAAYAMVVV